MTNTLALWLVALFIGFFVLDHYLLHVGAFLFLARAFFGLIETMAFWR